MQKVKKKRPVRYFDYNLLFIIIFLVGFGLVMLYSTSSYSAQIRFGDSAFYLKKQLAAVAIGFAALLITSFIPYKLYRKLSILIYAISFVLCALVLFAGQSYNGSARWLKLGPISFQPSEIAKVGMILVIAAIIYKIPKSMGRFSTVIKVLLIILPIVVMVAYSNLSTGIIIMGIAVCMVFVASPKTLQFFLLAAAVSVLGILFIYVEQYRAERIMIWLNPEAYEKGYQTLQGLYAIGSGGLFGKGLGESIQKLGFLPEAQNDMIFSIICEELGIFGAICVIILFLLMIWRFMIIANNAPDLFGALIVTGIMAHIAIQVILNIAVVTNTIPNTGITLPFISYGGTSVAILLAEMGIALNVSRGIKLEVI
ncbi:MAG: FtsW/RodA/SpoVE family cell cycle protein [Lachnospiraceae bacterium]